MEKHYEWLDHLTIEDIEKLAMQGYSVYLNDGHVIAIEQEDEQ